MSWLSVFEFLMPFFKSDNFVGYFGGLDFEAVCVMGVLVVFFFFHCFGRQTGNCESIGVKRRTSKSNVGFKGI